MLSNPLTKFLFCLCSILLARDVMGFYQIQGRFDDKYIVPLILLAILGHFAFEREK